ncbi:MAG: hypothetical protein OXU20_01390 [Myxococcales bacterium]|nr:hypothetical protein [Myxococcales bacterium]
MVSEQLHVRATDSFGRLQGIRESCRIVLPDPALEGVDRKDALARPSGCNGAIRWTATHVPTMSRAPLHRAGGSPVAPRCPDQQDR